MKYVILALALTHCTRYDNLETQGLSLTARITSSAVLRSGCDARAQLAARVLLEDTQDEPCELSVMIVDDAIHATGECAVFERQTRVVLQYYLKATSGAIVLIAESVGIADFQRADTAVVEVFFDSQVASLKPKTVGLASDEPTERNRFNCDRIGEDTCSTGTAADAETDVDTCSNLQELCAGTLFANTVEQCTQN